MALSRGHTSAKAADVEQETQLSLTNRATHLCKCNGVADLNTPRPTCSHSQFGPSALNDVDKYRRVAKLGSGWTPPLAFGASLIP